METAGPTAASCCLHARNLKFCGFAFSFSRFGSFPFIFRSAALSVVGLQVSLYDKIPGEFGLSS